MPDKKTGGVMEQTNFFHYVKIVFVKTILIINFLVINKLIRTFSLFSQIWFKKKWENGVIYIVLKWTNPPE